MGIIEEDTAQTTQTDSVWHVSLLPLKSLHGPSSVTPSGTHRLCALLSGRTDRRHSKSTPPQAPAAELTASHPSATPTEL